MVSIKFPSTQRSGSFVLSSSTPVVVVQNETLASSTPLCKTCNRKYLHYFYIVLGLGARTLV